MTNEEYDKRKAEMATRHRKEDTALAIQFAKENNPYKVGDILMDDSGKIIRVERITYSQGYYGNYPYCNYEGPALKKDLTPRKVSPTRGTICQPRVKEKLSD